MGSLFHTAACVPEGHTEQELMLCVTKKRKQGDGAVVMAMEAIDKYSG